ncbi:MAG: DNA replication and repair protein RecF, partial [Pseudomonadota bacterium]
MAACGARIAKARVDTLDRLREALEERSTSAFPQSLIDIDGTVEQRLIQGAFLDDVENDFRERLAETRPLDRRAGRSLTGPHRTALRVSHKAKMMPAGLCSTGEQKALLIGLVLAHARAQVTRPPVLLLDEVAAHLDADRRAALADELVDLGLQVFMTGTDAALFTAFGDRAQWLNVDSGAVTSVSAAAP